MGRISAGTVLAPESGSSDRRLEIKSATSSPSSTTVLTIDRPQIKGPRYRLSGRLRYEGVEGVSYLEMWNHFPDGSQYFSRTMADQGPMMKLQGTSGWRSFVLPFDATGAPPPTRLVVNVVLQGRGTVYLGPVELSEETGAASDLSGPLTTSRLAGLAGGVAGAVIGSLGALIGVLTSLGRARRFVIASATSLIAMGLLAFTAGIVAFASAGSYSTAYPVLLLLGFVSSVVPLGLLPTIRRRYEEIELRTMRAHDLGSR
ncbi:MAG TPA: hypothetical protein VM818_20375 [Vicinamibacterales bacterium]|nr:hypothetical protein [Vicinamibacterales bacterium]